MTKNALINAQKNIIVLREQTEKSISRYANENS